MYKTIELIMWFRIFEHIFIVFLQLKKSFAFSKINYEVLTVSILNIKALMIFEKTVIIL